ncbi:carboxypeptidase M32, partial [Patescibacteria group bacterium]
CVGLGPGDVRITWRTVRGILGAIFGVTHEAGHAIYSQGAPPRYDWMSPVGLIYSLGIHESQSRGNENFVCRSRPFWERYLPRLKNLFPQLEPVTLDEFVAAINTCRPTFIRVEADEATYNAHIWIRWVIERELMNRTLKVTEYPDRFNGLMQEVLGITPPDNGVSGCMQDIHHSGGLVGYFGTYSGGNLAGAQYAAKFREVNPDWEAQFRAGNFEPYRMFMRTNVHETGYTDTLNESLERVTGKPLSIDAWKRHIMERVGPVYNLN